MPAWLEIYKLLNFSQMTHFRQHAFVDGQATGGLGTAALELWTIACKATDH